MMREELTINKRRRRRQVFWRVAISIIFLLMATALASTLYQYQQTPQKYPRLQACAQRFANWLAERKAHFHDEMEKRQAMVIVSSHLSKADNVIQPHFEFYDMLSQNQDDSKSPTLATIADPIVAKPLTAVIKPSDSKMNEKTSHHVSPPIKLPVNSINNKPVIVAPDELEYAFADSLKTDHSIIQLGAFHNKAKAEHYRDSLLSKGIQAHIVTTNKQTFRVELGPFEDKTRIKTMMHDLAQRGIEGIVKTD